MKLLNRLKIFEQKYVFLRWATGAEYGKITYVGDDYIEFNVTGKCEVTLVGVSGSATDTRQIRVVNVADASNAYSFDMAGSQTKTTMVFDNAGTFRLKSGGSNVYLFYIIIEYYE